MSQAPDLLRVSSLARRFAGGNGISNISFAVPAGSVTGFIGVNGAGKSTTLRCIMGLLRPDAGEIDLFGAPACHAARARIGFLPEERGLFPHERAREAIAFHGRLKGLRRREALAAADRLLERIGLGARRNEKLASLSKGNAQRVQVLCALVHEPQLLLLDEPLSGLDPVGQTEMLSLLAEYRGRGGAVLFSTHSMSSAEKVCDRVVMISAGRTVFEGAIPDAAALSPHGAEVVTADGEGLTAAARSIGGHAIPLGTGMGEAGRWQVLLPRHVTHPVLVRALAEHGVPILNFQPIQASLEGAFWQLAQPAEKQGGLIMPILLIAEREFRTYVATLSFWLSLAIAPLAAGVAVLLSGGHSPQPLPISIQGGDAVLAHSAQTALQEAGHLEGHIFIFGAQGAALVLSRRAPQTLDVTFSDSFPLSPSGRAMVGHVIERDMARSQADAGRAAFSVSITQEQTTQTGIDAARVARLSTMTMLWLTLTGSLGMLLQAIVRERANRALESLLAAARSWEIVTGKLVGVGAVSLLILTAWLGSAALFSLFLPPQAGLVGAVLRELAHPLTLLRDATIYLCAYGFYGAATLVLGAMARDAASAQNMARPLFLVLLAAFFVALAAPADVWLTYLTPLTPFLLLVNSPGTVAAMSQTILLGLMILATAALMLLASRLLSVASGTDNIFKRGTRVAQPVV